MNQFQFHGFFLLFLAVWLHFLTVIFVSILGCRGYEANVQRCEWHRRQMGSGVCDHHPNLGIRCLPFHHRENR